MAKKSGNGTAARSALTRVVSLRGDAVHAEVVLRASSAEAAAWRKVCGSLRISVGEWAELSLLRELRDLVDFDAKKLQRVARSFQQLVRERRRALRLRERRDRVRAVGEGRDSLYLSVGRA